MLAFGTEVRDRVVLSYMQDQFTQFTHFCMFFLTENPYHLQGRHLNSLSHTQVDDYCIINSVLRRQKGKENFLKPCSLPLTLVSFSEPFSNSTCLKLTFVSGASLTGSCWLCYLLWEMPWADYKLSAVCPQQTIVPWELVYWSSSKF